MEIYKDFKIYYISDFCGLYSGYYGLYLKNNNRKYILTNSKIEQYDGKNTQLDKLFFNSVENVKYAIDKYYKQFEEKTEKEEFPKFEDVKKDDFGTN